MENRRYSFAFHGQYLDFLTLLLKNMFLTIVTLGMYFAWARTEKRRYLWQNTELDGHRLEYLGKAQDLFRAYAKLFVVYLVFVGASYILQLSAPLLFVIFKIAFGLAIFFLIPWVVYKARGYLLSHTRWKGIRMGMAPDATPYVHAYVKGWLLTLLTLGIYSPFRMNQLHRTITENTMIGNWKLQYDGKDSDVAGIFFKGLFLSILTLGIYFFWARAELLRYYASHTIVGQARGHLDLNGGDLFMLALMNLVLIPITLGLAIPWVALMNLRLMIGKFSLEGFIDVENLLQSQLKSTPAVSDGIAEIFDVGAGV